MKGRIWKPLVLAAVVFAIQLPAIFFGFDVNDTGYYLTFYDNIFSHPEAVSHNFIYYGSGLVGGLLLKLCGGSLVWMRIFGALCNVLMCLLVWWTLRGPGRFLPMLLASLIIAAGTLGTPLTFYNDIMSTLLTTMVMVLLIKATTKENNNSTMLIFVAGLVAGINLFSRIPNVLQVLFVVPLALVLYLKRGEGYTLRQIFRACRYYLSGWLSGVCIVTIIALILGHLPYLLDSVTHLTGTAASDPADTTHSLSSLIRVYLLTWLNILILPLSFIFPARFPISPLLVAYTVTVAGNLVACFRRKRTGQDSGRVAHPLRAAAIFALTMILILPAGSDFAINNAGPMNLWLALPLALIAISGNKHTRPWTTGASPIAGRLTIITLAIALIIPYTLSITKGELYFDSAPIPTLTANLRGIRTTPERANRLTAITTAVETHVPQDATLMVFDSAPMINYLTNRRPACGISWPAIISPQALKECLTKSPDYILIHNFPTLTGTWPDPYPEFGEGANLTPDGTDNQNTIFHNRRKSAVILEYINNNGYHPVASTPDFTLYKSPYIR